MAAANTLEAAAGRDVIVRGAAVSAGGSAAVDAGRDIEVGTVVLGDRRGTVSTGEHLATTSESHIGSTISTGRDLSMTAGRDATLTAAQVRADGTLGVVAGGNVTIGAAEDRSTFSFRGSGARWSAQGTSDTRRVIGSSLSAGQDILLLAGAQPAVPAAAAAAAAPPTPSSSDLLILGSTVRSDTGDVTLAATRDLVVASVAERSASQSQESRRSGSFLARKSVDEANSFASSVQVGSLVSGETITALAGRDLAVRGSQIAATGDVALRAGRNVEIVSTESTIASSQSRTERRSGFIGSVGGGGIGFTVGSQSQSLDVRDTSLVNTPSVVGSSTGSVAMEAAEAYRQRGSEVIAGQSIDIRAADVAIEAAQDRYTREEQQTFKRSGLAVSLGGPVVTNAVLARDAAMRIGDVEDDRLKAVYAVRVARLGYGAVKEAQQASQNPDTQFGVNVGFASSRSEQKQTTSQTVSVPSSVIADGDVRISATGAAPGSSGDLSVAGSVIRGTDVSLTAARDLTLRATQEASTLESSLSNSSAGAGVTLGVSRASGPGLIGFYVQGGRGSGRENGQTLGNVETLVGARGDLALQSGRDTTLAGAIASGETVTATVGRNLVLQSVQDVETYESRNRQASGGLSLSPVGVPTGIGGQLVQSRTDSDYASVREQTAIRAGAGGFDIVVGANTNLAGAVIDSTAQPDRNRLSTGTLTFSNIENRAEYSSSTVGGQAGLGIAPGGIKPGVPTPILGTGGSGKEQSTTYAAVAPGTLEIRNTQAQTQDVAALSRNPATAHEALERIFDKKTVAERQELATVFGQEAFIVVGDIAKSKTRQYEMGELARQAGDRYLSLKEKQTSGQASAEDLRALQVMENGPSGLTLERARELIARGEAEMVAGRADYEAWKEGSANKVALHAVVGAVQAAFGGAPAAAGALGAGTAESVRGLTEGLSPELQQWASVVIGAAAGAVAGSGASAGAGAGATAGAAAALAGEQFNRALHRSEVDRIKLLAEGDPIKEARLTAAACFLLKCSAGLPSGTSASRELVALEAVGEAFTEEQAVLKMQIGRINRVVNARLFTYSLNDSLNDLWARNQLTEAFAGASQAAGGGALLIGGVLAAPTCVTGVGCLAAAGAITFGLDQLHTGVSTAIERQARPSNFVQGLEAVGMPSSVASLIDVAAVTLFASGLASNLGKLGASSQAAAVGSPIPRASGSLTREAQTTLPTTSGASLQSNLGLDIPYEGRLVRQYLEDVFGASNVRSTTIPPLDAPRVALAGQRHPVTGIVYDLRGYPIFDDVAAFDTRIQGGTFSAASYERQMELATKDLWNSIVGGSVKASRFTADQLLQIQSGAARIEGYTWHHHQELGRMQLVPRSVHRMTGHIGGDAMSKGR